MAICRVCAKEFHYCCSCDYDAVLEKDFCSYICATKSQEFIEAKAWYDFMVETIGDKEKVEEIIDNIQSLVI